MTKALLTCLLLACTWLQAQTARVVRMAVFPHRPATFQDAEGRVQGFYVDMVAEVCRARGWELRFVPGSFAESLERLRRGEVDLGTSVAYTEERAAYLDYGGEASFTVWSILYANPKVPIQNVLDVQRAGLR